MKCTRCAIPQFATVGGHYFFCKPNKGFMKRDGATISLWQDTVADTAFSGQDPTNKTFDALIVGGGITGITTALLLQKAGKQCVVAEAHNLCFGTSSGTTSHINTFFDNSYDVVQSDFGADAAKLMNLTWEEVHDGERD